MFLVVACSAANEPDPGLSQRGTSDDGTGSGDSDTGDDTGDDGTGGTGDETSDTGIDTSDTSDTTDTSDTSDTGTDPVCGDGECQEPETQQTCPVDCKGPQNPVVQCLKENCGEPFDACNADPNCLELRVCAGECQGAPGCIQKCVEEFGEEAAKKLQVLIQCGQEAGCIGEGGECGDGVCDGPEDPKSCPEDCKKDPDPLECLEKACPDPLAACFEHPGCKDLTDCLEACESDDCEAECLPGASEEATDLLYALHDCGKEAGCFDEGPGPEGSCEDKCGQYVEDAPCQCDAQCAQFQDCCGDFEKFCSDDPGPDCGNGECEDGENPDNCPDDCGGDPDPVDACLQDSCPELYAECTENDACVELGECLDDCESNFCINQCFFGVPPQAGQIMQELLQCGDQNDCFDGGGPECGNGECEDGENPGNCPDDCEDDPPPPQGSCEGICGGQAQGGCWCDPQCDDFGDCCDDIDEFCDDGGGGNEEVIECLVDKCDEGQCLNFPGCTGGLECMSNCESEDCIGQCIEDAPNGAKNTLNGLWECGIDHDCFELDGEGPECGNGECEDGESSQECPQDCEALPPDVCIFELCNDQVDACTQSIDCVMGLQCVQECDGAGSCAEGCGIDADNDLLWEVLFCAFDHGCVGG